jgi:hypothetical protein
VGFYFNNSKENYKMSDHGTDSGLTSGASGSPNQNASQGAGDQQHSPAGEQSFEAVLQKMVNIEGQLRALQSDKDKGTAKNAKRLNTLEEQLARYDKYLAKFTEPAEAKRQMAIDDLLAGGRQETGESAEQQARPGSQATAPTVDYSATLIATHLDGSDAEVTAIIRDSDNPRLSLWELAERRASKPQTQANPAQVMSTGGGGSVGNEAEALTAKLQTLLKNPTANMTEISKVQAQLESLVKGTR